MKNLTTYIFLPISLLLSITCITCKEKSNAPSKEDLEAINLKKGDIILCGDAEQVFGEVNLETSCPGIVKEQFALALSMLHSFEYDEAEKVFAKVIDAAPDCAMAYWGVAMSNFHPLWTPPTESELEKGEKALAIAKSIRQKTLREAAYIDAISLLFHDWKNLDHKTRSKMYEEAMAKIYQDYPEDKEAAVLYALALDGTADPADTTFANQKKAGGILKALNPDQNDHPGLIHYMIHTYDSPALAKEALPAARKYASIAPSSAHAQHMPSHIFTRLGLWDESIKSNLVSADAAKCYAEASGVQGHWDQEMHALDYLMYAYLQKGENVEAKKILDYTMTINEVSASNFINAYSFAAIPARYALENHSWEDAAKLTPHPESFPWNKYPWQQAMIHFTHVIGLIHLDELDDAHAELKLLSAQHDTLVVQKDGYKSNQVLIQMKIAEGWIRMKEGKQKEALALLTEAANMEDLTQKHPVTPGEVIPAREFLADMLMVLNKPAKALTAYEGVLKKAPNRFNSLYGAGLAAEKLGQEEKAKLYYTQLISFTNTSHLKRTEVKKAELYVKRENM